MDEAMFLIRTRSIIMRKRGNILFVLTFRMVTDIIGSN